MSQEPFSASLIAKLIPASFESQAAISLVIKLTNLGCGFVFAVVAARLLGPSGYGEVAVALSAMMIAATLACAGIDGLAVREMARVKAAEEWGILRGFGSWALLVGAGASIMVGFVLYLGSSRAGIYADEVALAAAITPLVSLLFILRGLQQGAGGVVAAQLPIDVVRWLILFVALGATILMVAELAPIDIVTVALVSYAAALAVALVFYLRLIRNIPSSQQSAPRGRSWMIAATPFFGLAAFGIIGTEINTLLLGSFAGPRETGLYQPIAKIAPIMLLAVQAVAMPLAPTMAELWQKEAIDELKATVRRSTMLSTLSTTAIVGTIMLASPWILAAFGPEFQQYNYLLYWIGAAQIVNAAAGAGPMLLAMAGRMRDRLAVQAVTLIVQAGIGLALIERFGAEGAAIALITAILVWSLLHWAVALKTLGVDTSIWGAALHRLKRGEER
ncbi:oligosaccharide flippase family protein [Parasphingopyxis sp. CP4]|uniref:oligosaccharide flippase family protein n=1 Tax=Parasphingopyxis sp. CP4 TaxID=2724527 RepID=UPI0015A09DE7|nr:oligosaccharide flippase family protein [Parasphingopyxis sp. CP4]QLC22456.1 oligosaccharide flippase family protein [Parasphingopyxis sp. CP4]